MNKRLVRIIGGAIFLLVMTYVVVLINDNYLNEQENLRRPNDMGSYRDAGYFKIDPKTILLSLEGGDPNVFTPLLEDPQDVKELTNISIHWAQADFLKIASALGQFVWNDPMDLKDWRVYYIDFEGNCGDPIGFGSARITYFKTGRKGYVTRLIEIEPYFGLVKWGDGETYPKPILRKWGSVDLPGSKITAEDALRIAGEDVKVRFKGESHCGVLMGSPQHNDDKNWYLRFFLSFPYLVTYVVNLDTGDYIIQNPNINPTSTAP